MKNKWLPVFSLAIAILILPLTVNADFADEIKLLASDGASQDQFGWSISISGDTAIVGAPVVDNNGAAYIFVRDPVTGAWTQQQKLLATNGVFNDRFGESVSISGDTAIVGVKGDDDNGESTGSAYVFVRDPATGNWTQQQKLLASDGAAYHIFGKSVAISGDTAIVGADFTTLITVGTGQAYVFVRDPATGVWTEQQKLLASDGALNDFFGYRVAIDGDTALVGAIGEGVSFVGAVYAFVRDPATGDWAESQKLLTSNASSFDRIGESVSIDGDMAIIGASGEGSAYIFERDPVSGDWTEQQQLWDPNGVFQNDFGVAVSISGDYAIVGERSARTAFAYVRDPVTGLWTGQKLLPTDNGNQFGISVSIDGDRTIIGASGANGIEDFAGAAYVYTNTVVATPDITVTDSVAPIDDLQVSFGDVTEMTTADQTVTVTNDGNADLLLGNLAQADPLASPFSILNDTCSAQTLTPAANCSLTVRFSPPSTGAFSDSFDIPSDDPDENPVTVNVDGTGIGLVVPDITVTDSAAPVDDLAIAFGNVTQATTSDETVTITNDGNADLTIGNIGALDVLVAPFSILNDTCSGQTVTPAANCTLTVRFEPTAAGTFNDSFDIPSDDADEASVTVNLSGTGTAIPVPDITVTDSVAPAGDLQVPFGNVTEGAASNKIVTITNDGSADLTLAQIALVNPLAAPFSILNDTCSAQILTPAASCTLTVRFAPTVAGTFNDSFDIPSDDPDEGSVTVNLSATGVVVDDDDGGFGSMGPLELLFGLLGLVLVFAARNGERREDV
ncbi:hypothetical protein DJ030_14850 [bacterium endosymbiont of Escarpia laminata]|nr:MAG: hypothetical protein DJ030_14850 [bacterium endosymbiont of Escarpia laminata]